MEDSGEEKHSRMGVASFVISLVAGIAMLALFIVAGMLHRYHQQDGQYPGQVMVGLVMIFLFFAELVAVGLGIASVCEKGRKKVFGILGLSFSALTVLGAVGLIVLGLKMVGKI
jgi:hypothetical protein